MSVAVRSVNLSINFFLSDFFSGRKPHIQNAEVSNPDSTSALIAAHGPLITVYSSPRFISSSARILPGSEIMGMPASDTSARFSPFSNLSAIYPDFSFSENF